MASRPATSASRQRRRPAAAGILAAGGVPAGGLPSLTAVLTAMEAGVPIPVPSDLVVLLLGERVSAGRLSALAAVLALELVALVGTTALFLAVRGPGKALLARVGPRLGLTEARVARATSVVDRRGPLALSVGRATPGLRTVTVAAAATSGLTPGKALPPLVVGSSIFLQLHLLLGWALGPAAREALDRAKGPAVAGLALVAVVGVVFWVRRRGRRAGTQAASEACCPACLALGVLAPRAFALQGLTPDDPTQPGGQPTQ